MLLGRPPWLASQVHGRLHELARAKLCPSMSFAAKSLILTNSRCAFPVEQRMTKIFLSSPVSC